MMEANAHYAIILCAFYVLTALIALNAYKERIYQLLVIAVAQIIIIEMEHNAHYVMTLCV